MGTIQVADRSVDLAGLDREFYYKKVLPWTSQLPFDTIATSGYRSIERQKAMRAEYEIKLAAWYKKWSGKETTSAALAEKPAVVNKPGSSSHNYGLGIDIHPADYTADHYEEMNRTAPAYGLRRDANEKWHFQEASLTLAKMAEWIKANPGTATGAGLGLILLIAGAITFFILTNKS
jgi:hypothetical protein